MPRSAILTVAALAAPPPPSSVNRNGRPSCSTAVSSMPATSNSSIIRLIGAPNASIAALVRAICAGSACTCMPQNGTKESVRPPACRSITASHDRQDAAIDVVRDHRGDRAVPPAGEGAVQVDLVDRRDAGAGKHRRQIQRRDQDHAAGDRVGLEAAGELHERDRALVLVAVIAAGEEERRPGAVPDHHDRHAHRAPGRTRCWNGARSAPRTACRRPRGRSSRTPGRARP